ncbi:MAG TPA: hypothetical protein VJ508_12775 [Saprospiraceae bacterium]|nr:hypothetical protein [Saprospiraceae bacterium]
MTPAFKLTGLFILVFLLSGMQGQSQDDLRQLLAGKTKFPEIMQVVENYYHDHPETNQGEEFESDYLQWMRWAWYMSSRLGQNGEFVNINEYLMRGLEAKDKMETDHERDINSAWTFVGPSNILALNDSALYRGLGRVDRIVFHPTNANIIFVCTPAGGLWSTLNGGTNWNNLTDNLPSLGISGFVISYANTSDMYLLTGDGDTHIPLGGVEALGYLRFSIGILKSTDGGVSWHQTGTLPNITDPYVGYALVQSPTEPETLLAATSNGLYRTTDGGATWVRKISLPIYDVKYRPGDGTRAYASVQGDFWITTDSGNTWNTYSTYNNDPANCGSGGGRTRIAVTPANPNIVYLLSGPVTGVGTFCGLWISVDAGLTFTLQSTTPNIFGQADNGMDDTDQSDYDLAIAVAPTISSSLVAAGCSVWRSANSGGSWTHATSYHEGQGFPYIHPDVHELAYNPLNNYLYAGTDGGFYRSTNFGVTWTNLSPGLATSQFYHLAGWDGNANKLMCGLQDNGINYRNANSTSFYHISQADGFDVVFNPDNGTPLYGTVNKGQVRILNDGHGDTTMVIPYDDHWFKPIAVHNTNPDTLFIGTIGMYKSFDAGHNWNFYAARSAWCLTSCPSNNNRLYCAGGQQFYDITGNLYFTNDLGVSWVIKSGNPGFPAQTNWDKITDIAVRPTSSSVVWACFSGFHNGYKVVMSTNTGDTWTNMTANLPNVPMNCLAIDSDNGAYVGTDIGVFYRSSTMTQWMPWSNGLPNTPVTDLVIFDDGTTRKIRAATYGRGVWQGNLAQTCDPAVVVTGNLEGIRHYEAYTSISSSGFVQGGLGTFVSFKAGSYITLTEGFNVVDASEFLGFISPCGQGGIPGVDNDHSINRADPNSSIILLRRMWDPDDGLPYGAIKNIEVQHGQAHIQYKIKKPGKVEIVVARQVQENLTTLFSGDQVRGTFELNADITALPHEMHYVLLFYEGKLAHFQELNLE